ncbi:hypothetical protein [Lacticaseibacillus yichunensis]|uniref:CopG family transcriptional regulator n=1 Tax=Lacticaseibacillus yichunensis TaxID=2486015 RepID=A0ABW4CQP0_9LACO|nr:hypothetical protein [Lacticaseibacillus yichunensis]
MADKITVTLTPEMAAELKAACERGDESVDAVVSRALTAYFIEEQRARDFALEDDCND